MNSGVNIPPSQIQLTKVHLGGIDIPPCQVTEADILDTDSQSSDQSQRDNLDESWKADESGGTTEEEKEVEREEEKEENTMELTAAQLPSDSTMFIVSWTKLRELLQQCKICGSKAAIKKIFFNGSMIGLSQRCIHRHEYTWTSQPYVNRVAEGNLRLAAAVLFR